jgi:hypothetical protein
MINRATGEVDFQSGLRILPHCYVRSLSVNAEPQPKLKRHRFRFTGWKRHVLGFHTSEHGTFEVEALSARERIQVVLLAHSHAFYEQNTPNDAERRAFHEGVINSDLAGQREFTWGEVTCRLDNACNKDWLVIAYSREAKVPLHVKEVLSHLYAHEKTPEANG